LWTVAEDRSSFRHKTGRADRVLSNRGELFSYRYSIPADLNEETAAFEYENHSQSGRFRMHSLAWVQFGRSDVGLSDLDTITFSGFGVWSKDGTETVVQAAVQISETPSAPWIGIQIARADISDVDTPVSQSYFPIPAPSALRR
jgi:hypothetical protein